MSTPSFDAYRREYEAEGVGELLYGLILELTRQVAPPYPPDVYSPNPVWDEDALTSLCHDFIVEKLLGAGWLEHHLLAQDTVGALKMVLKRDLTHFLIGQRRRSEYQNLFGRVKRILRDDPRFRIVYPHGKAVAEVWGLSAQNGEDVAQQLDEIVEAMYAVDLPPLVRYRPDSRKHSHLLSSADLARLLESTFQVLGKCVRLDLLMEGLRYRLGLPEMGWVSLDAGVGGQDEDQGQTYAEIIPSLTNTELEVTCGHIAEDLLERLTDRQRSALALSLSLPNPSLESIADILNVSKSSVHSDLAAVRQLIGTAAVTQEEAERVLSQLSRLCVDRLEQVHGDTYQA